MIRQQQHSILEICLLLAYSLREDLRDIHDPRLKLQLAPATAQAGGRAPCSAESPSSPTELRR